MRLVEKLQSRKFWLAFMACVYFALTGGGPEAAFPAITQVVVAYLAVQAAQDALTDWQEARYAASPPVQQAPDAGPPEPAAPEGTD